MLAKLPPREKIYEAWSALSSGRVTLLAPPEAAQGEAQILSSDGAKKYFVSWQGNVYRSTDSATYWQGYPGYPVLAVLMLRGLLPYDKALAELFAHIDWRVANERAKRDYALALAQVCDSLELGELEREKAVQSVTKVMHILEKLDVKIGRYNKKPPKAAEKA